MATIYFGAIVYPSGRSANGNWQDITQWYSDLGSTGGKGVPDTPATPLNRLPYNTDTVQCYNNNILSNVGYWNGTYPSGSWVSGTFGGGVINGICSLSVTWTGAIAGGSYANSTMTGSFVSYPVSLNNVNVTGATFGANIAVYLYGTTASYMPSTLTNVGIRLVSGTLNSNLVYNSSWNDSTYQGAIAIFGGTFGGNISFGTTIIFSDANIQVYGGTIVNNINTSVTGLRSFVISGGTFQQSADFVFGTSSLRANSSFNVNIPSYYSSILPTFTPSFSTSKNINLYSRGSVAGYYQSSYITFGVLNSTTDTNRYTGYINVYNTTESGSNYASTLVVYSGIYAPTLTLPIINKTGGTGKGVDTSSFPKTWGFSAYQPNLYVSGSSDILQSELA